MQEQDTDEKFLCRNPFPKDAYDTPENYPKSLWEYATFGSRLSFYLRNFYIFARSGYLAKHTDFPAQVQTDYSLKNFRIVESCGGRIHLRGLDNLSKVDGPAIIIGNHMSLLETAVIHAFLRPRKDFCFVIKDGLQDIPYFGDIMRKMQCIPVSRKNPRNDLRIILEEGEKRLKAGKTVIVFPQHTRSTVFDEEAFNTIGVKLARRTGAPIIPMALRTDFLGVGKICRDMGPLHRKNPVWFVFGEPIRTISGTGREENRQIMDFIEQNLKQWGCSIKTDNRKGLVP